MEIIEYEPINLYDGRFCKVFHSDWIQLEKPKDVNSAVLNLTVLFREHCAVKSALL